MTIWVRMFDLYFTMTLKVHIYVYKIVDGDYVFPSLRVLRHARLVGCGPTLEELIGICTGSVCMTICLTDVGPKNVRPKSYSIGAMFYDMLSDIMGAQNCQTKVFYRSSLYKVSLIPTI